jgi:hypothetical protein
LKLEIESVWIDEMVVGEETGAESGVLTVNTEELRELLLEDPRIDTVDINVVSPGQPVRVLNVQDVIQPRCKIGGVGSDFPGFVGKMQIAGSGRTRSLLNVGVLVSNPCTNRAESALLDMDGPMASMSRYGKMHHLSVAPSRAADVGERDFEDAVKVAGLKSAVFLAQKADGLRPSEVEVFELVIPNVHEKSDLPRVACYYQVYTPQFDYLATSDPCFYGTDTAQIMPMVVHPNEVLDGGVVGWNAIKALDTYSIQNHGIIKELYRHHGKDLIFAGVVMAAASLEAVPRARNACIGAHLVKEVLGADGVILQKITGGMPHIDLAMTAEECEKLGVRTAVHTQPLTPFGTLADTILFNAESLDLVITSGATFERTLIEWKAEEFLGGTAETRIFCPDPIVQFAGDSVIDVEEYLLPGVLDNTGDARVIVREY